MKKALIAMVVSFSAGLLATAYLFNLGNFQGVGTLLTIAIMGGFIIYFNENKK